MTFGDEEKSRIERTRMVDEQLVARGIRDPRVLEAFYTIPRHLFVPPSERARAYDDCAIRLGPEQSISQPYIVAHMLEQLELSPSDRVLEIGTGSGYQTALLGCVVSEVYSIEIDPGLSAKAAELLHSLGILNCTYYVSDGGLGLPAKAPFDAIVVTAAADKMPRELIRQLAPGGRLILPLSDGEEQVLVLVKKTPEGLEENVLGPVRFVRLQHSEN